MKKINIWSDFACPYCYIGEKRLLNAINELKVNDKFEIVYHAFELDPSALKQSDMTSVERIASKYGIPIEKAKQRVLQIDNLGKELGIDFIYVSARPSNTFDAHRLMKLAEVKYDKVTVEKLNFGLFDAYFTKNLVLANWDVLKKVAKEAGMKEEDVNMTLESVEYADDVRMDENEAKLMGVRGVPYFIVDNKYAVPGCISQDDFKDLINNLLNEKSTAGNNKDSMECCGPDGCQVNK